ncbi:MAG: RNA polymerase sigma factor [Wenzhouxiangella sp.]
MPLSADELESGYRRLEKPLYNYLFRWFWDAAVCEDLIHDAFERIWKRRAGIDGKRIDALVWTAVINLARSRHRHLQRWKWVALPRSLVSSANPETGALGDEREQSLRQALSRLPGKAREALLLELHAGMSRSEIARCLGIPEGTLASRKHAAIVRLQSLLEVNDDTP